MGHPCSSEISFRTDRAGAFEVVRADISTPTLIEVTSAGGLGAFSWSPDGSQLVYSKSGPQGASFTGLYVADAQTGESSLLVDMDVDAASPVWAPSGHAIAFHTVDGEGADLLWVHAQTATIELLAEYPGASSLHVAWNPDADAVVVAVSGEDVAELWRVAVPSAEAQLLDDSLLEYAHPAWSPTSDEIAFAGNDEFFFRAHLIGADGTDLRAVTEGFAIHIAWAPDEERLVYRGAVGQSDFRLFTVDLASGQEALLVPDLTCNEPQWCDDPDLILTWCEDGKDSHVYLVQPEDGAVEPFAAVGARDEFAQWRPAPT
jgi:Tol biopolymer transport system component